MHVDLNHLMKCRGCGQQVSATQFVKTLSAHQIFIAATVAYNFLSHGKLSEQEIMDMQRGVARNNFKYADVWKDTTKCNICLQKLPPPPPPKNH